MLNRLAYLRARTVKVHRRARGARGDLAQLLTYLRLSNLQIGLLLNFNAVLLKHGIRRYALSSFACSAVDLS